MRVACCFTGGKDSCLVAHLLAQSNVAGLKDAPQNGVIDEGFIYADTVGRMLPCNGSQLTLLVTFAPIDGPPFKAHPINMIKLQVNHSDLICK